MEAINLNLIPNGTNPVVHCSQYDEGREFRFNLFDGASVLTLDGTETIECDVKKPDGNIVTVAVTNTSDSYIVVTTTLQMTACSGNSLGTIKISKGGDNLYTLNFVLYCERSPLENGIQSDSAIHNLATQVAQDVAIEVANQYDSANVIFDATPTSGHGSPYTVTSEGIKTAIDNAFDYDNTASGSLIHIEDGADNIPVKSLVSQIVAVESGNGQPKSPTNPYSISGFASGVVTRCGKNLVTFSTTTITTQTRILDNIYLKAGVYTFSIDVNNTTNIAGTFNIRINTTTIDTIGFVGNYQGRVNKTFTLSQDSTINIVLGGASVGYSFIISNAQIELGDTATTHEAYNGNDYTFAFGQTVYGGHFDNKGNLVVTHGFVDLGSLTWSGLSRDRWNTTDLIGSIKTPSSNSSVANIICSTLASKSADDVYLQNEGISVQTSGNTTIYSTDLVGKTSAEVQTALVGVKLLYELATPTTLTITSQDIPTALGENNIFSNCGNLEVEYYTEKANDVIDFIDSEIGKKNGTNILIEANSPDSIKTYIDSKTPNLYFRNDIILNSDGGTIIGVGAAMITMQSGIARIDFNLKITVAETVQNIFTWGINRDYFTALTGKQITPQVNGSCVYYDDNNVVDDNNMDLGGTFLVNGQFWQPARVYDDNGTKRVGAWASLAFQQNSRIVGTCYGTYT